MIPLQGLFILLLCQTAGELLARGLHLPFPGPVLGMLMCLAVLTLPAARQPLEQAAQPLLQHLSLLFVPVGVGVVAHLGLLANHGVALAGVLLASTLVGLAVTAAVLKALLGDTAKGTDGADGTNGTNGANSTNGTNGPSDATALRP